MSFTYPLGLLGLIGIPILILIYIIKNKFTEQIVPTTYLWTLSEKFLPKRKPISLVSGIISLILQIIAVITLSLAIAHPIITLPNSAKEYCFILDASGSMNTVTIEGTRLEVGKDKIEEIIYSSTDGSKFTLIYAGDTNRVVYEKLGDKDKAVQLLNKLEPSGMSVSYNGILKQVQEYFNSNKSLVTYLVTDKQYTSNNVEIINVSNNESNYSVIDTNYLIIDSKLQISGHVISYTNDTTLNLDIYVNDLLEGTVNVDVIKGQEAEFNFESETLSFESIKVVIKNEDSLSLDNTNIIYNLEKKLEYKALIISDNPFYLYNAITTVGNADVFVISPSNYSENIVGFDLYIFDSFTPTNLPSDGTIWLFGVEDSINGAGFSVKDIIEDEAGFKLSYPNNSTALYKTLTNGLSKEDIYVCKYVKYGLYKNFTTLLTYEGNPIVFTGLTDKGCREVVFAFDLHDSNLPLLMDYLLFTKNLLDYSFPEILEKSLYTCGDIVEVNVLSNCDSIRIESPKGNISYLDTSLEIADFVVSEAGTYNITVVIGDEVKEIQIYVSLPTNESFNDEEIQEMSLQGELENNYSDGIYNKLIIFFIILAVIYLADWVVYCYEQNHLR